MTAEKTRTIAKKTDIAKKNKDNNSKDWTDKTKLSKNNVVKPEQTRKLSKTEVVHTKKRHEIKTKSIDKHKTDSREKLKGSVNTQEQKAKGTKAQITKLKGSKTRLAENKYAKTQKLNSQNEKSKIAKSKATKKQIIKSRSNNNKTSKNLFVKAQVEKKTGSQTENVWDTLGIPNIKDAVKKTANTEEFKWAIFFASLIGIIIIIGILYIAANIFIKHYKVEKIFVEGSTHYSNEEIQNMVMEGPLGDNSLYLGFKYKDKAIENVPFVQRMDIEVIDAKSIRIRVYEKAVAGYFEHLGRYVYFDKDGIVIETSEKETPGIPLVTGLKFNYVVMYEPLPVEKKEIFEDILDITQLLNKYQISADKIYFDNDNRKTLYFGKARVSLGNNDNIDEKILKLKYILPKLEGLSGVLRMDNYSEGVTNITFEEDKE